MMFHDDFPLTAMEVGADMAPSACTSRLADAKFGASFKGCAYPQERIRHSLSPRSRRRFIPAHVLAGYSKETACHKRAELLGEALELARW